MTRGVQGSVLAFKINNDDYVSAFLEPVDYLQTHTQKVVNTFDLNADLRVS